VGNWRACQVRVPAGGGHAPAPPRLGAAWRAVMVRIWASCPVAGTVFGLRSESWFAGLVEPVVTLVRSLARATAARQASDVGWLPRWAGQGSHLWLGVRRRSPISAGTPRSRGLGVDRVRCSASVVRHGRVFSPNGCHHAAYARSSPGLRRRGPVMPPAFPLARCSGWKR